MAGEGAFPFRSGWFTRPRRGAVALLGSARFGDGDFTESTVWSNWLFDAEDAGPESEVTTAAEVTWPGARTRKKRQITLAEVINLEQAEQRNRIDSKRDEPAPSASGATAEIKQTAHIKTLIMLPQTQIEIAAPEMAKPKQDLRLKQEEEEMALLLVLAN